MSKINVAVNEFKIGLEGIEYTFRLDFRALLKFTKCYENAMVMLNELLAGKNYYENMIKILSCSCVEKDFTEEELSSKLSFNFKTMKVIDDITFALVEGLLSDEDKGNEKSKSGKENKTSKN